MKPVVDLVLDTNVLLDLWVFQDERVAGLRDGLRSGALRWVASPATLDEFQHIRQQAFTQRYAGRACADWPPPCLRPAPVQAAPWRCRDGDDQKFLDLAWAHRLPLWTRDRDLLSLRRRAARDGLWIGPPEQGQALLDATG